jgi:hypothetical protein
MSLAIVSISCPWGLRTGGFGATATSQPRRTRTLRILLDPVRKICPGSATGPHLLIYVGRAVVGAVESRLEREPHAYTSNSPVNAYLTTSSGVGTGGNRIDPA